MVSWSAAARAACDVVRPSTRQPSVSHLSPIINQVIAKKDRGFARLTDSEKRLIREQKNLEGIGDRKVAPDPQYRFHFAEQPAWLLTVDRVTNRFLLDLSSRGILECRRLAGSEMHLSRIHFNLAVHGLLLVPLSGVEKERAKTLG
jgi:hypothetical protein